MSDSSDDGLIRPDRPAHVPSRGLIIFIGALTLPAIFVAVSSFQFVHGPAMAPLFLWFFGLFASLIPWIVSGVLYEKYYEQVTQGRVVERFYASSFMVRLRGYTLAGEIRTSRPELVDFDVYLGLKVGDLLDLRDKP